MRQVIFTLLILLFYFRPINGQVTGSVLDENGAPLSYASVYVRGTTHGVATNRDGEFKLPLDPGEYTLVFHYIGYQQHFETVKLDKTPVRLRIQLQPSDLEINEVTITTEDPAVGIMRKVIEKRDYYDKKRGSYSASVYIKGFYEMIDAPEKILGQEVGDMDGMLDSTRKGVIYLSESFSTIHLQSNPRKWKEVMISSKVSGDSRGFSFNRAALTNFNLYREYLEIIRPILTPLADNAFQHYRFKFLGKEQDENGYGIYKIGITPKNSEGPAFNGVIYIVDDLYNIAGCDLYLTSAALNQPIIDTFRIRQQYIPVEKPDDWRLLNQVTSLRIGIFGFKIAGWFNGVFTDYVTQAKFDKDFFDREVFRIEDDANKKDTTYWSTLRPIPLTELESNDYVRKDSLQNIWDSPAYRDSMDRKSNRFKYNNIFNGYSWVNSRKHIRVGYPAAAKWIQYNTIQGWLLNIEPTFTKESDEDATAFWRTGLALNYGFSEQRFRPSFSFVRQFESIHYRTLSVSGGIGTQQFNPRNPISETVNFLYTFWAKRNYLKLFENRYGTVSWSQRSPGIQWSATATYTERAALENNAFETLYKGSQNRILTPNAPEFNDLPYEPFFKTHQALVFSAEVKIRIGEYYASYPRRRFYLSNSKWPELTVSYTKAVAGIAGSDINYDLLKLHADFENLKVGLLGSSQLKITAGWYLNQANIEYMDFYQPLGNQTIFGPRGVGNTMNAFFLLPYYGFRSGKQFIEAHWEHQLEGWLFDKIPLIKKLGFQEVLSAKIYYTDDTRPVNEVFRRERLPYWEAGIGITKIGIKAIRPLRVDFVASFFGNQHHRNGILLTLNF